MAKFNIEWHEILFVILIGIFGFLASTKTAILSLNKLNPFLGFLVYYFIWFILIFILSLTGFVILGQKIENPIQIVGTLFIVFSVSVIINFTSGYTYYITTGDFGSASQIFLASEDGVLFYLFHDFIKISSLFIDRILTYVVSPMILSFIGMLLVRKVKFNLFN